MTGVQTCALPIFKYNAWLNEWFTAQAEAVVEAAHAEALRLNRLFDIRNAPTKAERLSAETGFPIAKCLAELDAEDDAYFAARNNLRSIKKAAHAEALEINERRRLADFFGGMDFEARKAAVDAAHVEALEINRLMDVRSPTLTRDRFTRLMKATGASLEECNAAVVAADGDWKAAQDALIAAQAPKSGFDMDNDGRGFICGVRARMTNRNTHGRSGDLFFKQTIITEERPVGGDYPKGCTIRAEIRFDDSCGNRHNSFAITAAVINPRRRHDWEAGGCLHDDIARVFPELAHLIKWHLCSSDGPMHYISNTVYHASDRANTAFPVGAVTKSEKRLTFNGVPFTFTPKKVIREWLESKTYGVITAFDVETVITPVEHIREPGGYEFAPKYTFAGCAAGKWHEAPFDSVREAEEFRDALKLGWGWITIPTAWAKGKARDLDAARNSGVWPDATDAELCAEPEVLEEQLMARLPALLEAMKRDITGAGLLWSAAAETVTAN